MAKITLEQSIASTVRFILNNDVEGTKTYFDEIPDAFYVPSIYFPIPTVEGRKATLRTYLNAINITAWFQSRSDWEAEARAASVRDQIMLQGLHIPVLDESGEPTGRGMIVQEPTQRKIEEGIVSLTIQLRDYFYAEDLRTTAGNINFLDTWKSATEDLREEANDGTGEESRTGEDTGKE